MLDKGVKRNGDYILLIMYSSETKIVFIGMYVSHGVDA